MIIDGLLEVGDNGFVTVPEELPQIPQIRTPENLTAGVYANGIAIGFSQLDFTMDFLVGLMTEEGQLPDGQRVNVLPSEVVARIRINPSLAWQIARNLTEVMQAYEDQFGKIRDLTDYGAMDSPVIGTDSGEETDE